MKLEVRGGALRLDTPRFPPFFWKYTNFSAESSSLR